MTRRLLGYTALALIFLLPVSAAAVTLEVVPSTSSANLGDPFTVDVIVSGLGDTAAPSLSTFDLDLLYDPVLFNYTGVVYGPELGDEMAGEATTITTPGPGIVQLLELSILPPADLNANQPDSFTLLTASFTANVVGLGAFDVSVDNLGDENGAPLVVDAVTPATVDVVTGAPTDIPTLSQWGLILLAALLFVAAARGLRRVER